MPSRTDLALLLLPAFVTGHTLLVDGDSWLGRDFVMPEFTPVGDQLSQVQRKSE